MGKELRHLPIKSLRACQNCGLLMPYKNLPDTHGDKYPSAEYCLFYLYTAHSKTSPTKTNHNLKRAIMESLQSSSVDKTTSSPSKSPIFTTKYSIWSKRSLKPKSTTKSNCSTKNNKDSEYESFWKHLH